MHPISWAGTIVNVPCNRLGHDTEVVDYIGICRADTGIPDGQNLVLLVGDDIDVKLLVGLEDRRVSERS